MFWALLFAITISIFGGESPYLIPHMNKYIKKHVNDTERKDKILTVLKQVKKERKSRVKENKKMVKEINEMFSSRKSTPEDFNMLTDKINEVSKNNKIENSRVRNVFKENILLEEWEAMKPDLKKALKKLKKTTKKTFDKLDKNLIKLNSKIESNIVDIEKRKEAKESLAQFKDVITKKSQFFYEQLSLDKSILLNYEISNVDFEKFQSELSDVFSDIMEAQIIFHNEMVKSTTEKEWDKIIGKRKIF